MTWDAVVIGAGPAGAVASRELARRGASVLLVDKAAFPRPKVCGCCLNRAAVAALESLGLGHVLAGAVPLDRTVLAAGMRSAEVRLPGGVALSREAFDAALVREAVAAGVAFRPGVMAKVAVLGEPGAGATGFFCRTVRSVLASGGRQPPVQSPTVPVGLRANRGLTPPARQDSDRAAQGASGELLLTLSHGDGSHEPLAARAAILATGLNSSDTRVSPTSRIGAGVVVPDAPAFFAPGTVYMATGRGGYVGLVRVEGGRLDVAAAFDAGFVKASGGLGPAAETILNTTGWPSIPDLAALPWKGTPALTRTPATLASHRVFAVGDAAGYVEPFTGEGMAWAITSAAALAPIAVRAVANWDDALAGEWQRTHARLVGRRQRVCRVVARVLRSPALTGLAVRALRIVPALSRPVVAVLNRPALLPHGSPA